MKAKVLIIDDTSGISDALRARCEGALELDADTLVVPDIRSGIAAAQRFCFDVAVVLVTLPGLRGDEVIGPLQAASRHAEVVVVTDLANMQIGLAALRGGAFALIPRSLPKEVLVSAVAQAAAKVALKREREDDLRRVHTLVDATDVLIIGLDSDGRINLYNRRLATLVGVPESDAIGQSFAHLFVDDTDHDKLQHALAAALAHKAGSEVQVGMRDAAGAMRRVRLHLSGVRGTDNGAKVVYAVGIDVTERRALERRAADAEALNAMAPLALGLAHEIRNPLNAAVLELHLLGRGIERLADPAVRDPMRRRVGIVDSEIRRLERLLTDFLELARPRAPQREPVDLGRVVSEVLDLEEEATAAHHLKVVRDLGVDCFAQGDVEKLKQVVLNLVVNSLDAMPDVGTLCAAVGSADNEVWLSIGDTGPGVDPTILADIFDPFFTTKAAGTGLGLAIVRKIVDQHQGRVVVESKKGEGTTVRVVLPAACAKERG